MDDWAKERATKLRDFFGLASDRDLLSDASAPPEVSRPVAEHLARFNLEWHIIPSSESVPFDHDYAARLYPMCSRKFEVGKHHSPSCREALVEGHRRHQGRILGVETTLKPRYLPGNRQYYGTLYGFDSTADPFSEYLGKAKFLTGTRYDHNYVSLRDFLTVVNNDWRARDLMPKGYRLTICPPAVFNLIGTIFHPEWSQTETLELGFYRDAHGNAKCYVVGSNGPGDFSYMSEVETGSDWALLGFRTVLVPE